MLLESPDGITMKPTSLFAVALLALTTWPAMAVNKCINDAGQVVYQSAPCPATAKGSEIAIQKAPPVTAPSPSDAEELKRIQQTAGALERENKLKEINREIANREGAIADYRQLITGEMDRLQRKKQYASNNLAGATWEQSISAEMNAVAQKYDSLIRNEQSQIERLRADADRMQK